MSADVGEHASSFSTPLSILIWQIAFLCLSHLISPLRYFFFPLLSSSSSPAFSSVVFFSSFCLLMSCLKNVDCLSSLSLEPKQALGRPGGQHAMSFITSKFIMHFILGHSLSGNLNQRYELVFARHFEIRDKAFFPSLCYWGSFRGLSLYFRLCIVLNISVCQLDK